MLNPRVELDPVVTDGYSHSDMNMYYSGSFLLWTQPEEEPELVRFLEMESDTDAWIEDADGDRHIASVEQLSRFVFPQGLYIQGSELISVNYRMTRNYKKGISPELIETSSRSSMWAILKCVLFPQEDATGRLKVLTPRLAVQEDKLIIYTNMMSVGTVREGYVETPFPCISQRIQELGGLHA